MQVFGYFTLYNFSMHRMKSECVVRRESVVVVYHAASLEDKTTLAALNGSSVALAACRLEAHP